MKLIKLHIENFGKLHNIDLNFNSFILITHIFGLNFITLNNFIYFDFNFNLINLVH